MAGVDSEPSAPGGYRHEAMLYEGCAEFLRGTLEFITDAMAADEPVLVVVDAGKIDSLRGELRGRQGGVHFADMADVGANPARIIPAWQDFLDEHAAPHRRVRGIGEPISPGRSQAELAECQRHEALLNLAFADPAFWLLCPYDTATLDPAVIDEARATHAVVHERGRMRPSPNYRGIDAFAGVDTRPLPTPPDTAPVLTFRSGAMSEVRRFVADHAAREGLAPDRVVELVLASDEIGTNSLRHGGGAGTVTVWSEPGSVVCEVRDQGRIGEPLAGRKRPSVDGNDGRGLWLANQLCDLVQVRSAGSENVVRLWVRRPTR
jgi:anti-sigma regulatory factor (Ser/Thr protein kinase)